jgi:protein gp37
MTMKDQGMLLGDFRFCFPYEPCSQELKARLAALNAVTGAQIRARTKFLSLEPLLGPLPRLNLKGINWVIVDGESGPGARPLLEEWVIDLRDQCKAKRVPFFFKQWGGVQKKRAGRLLQGRTWDEMPALPNLALA